MSQQQKKRSDPMGDLLAFLLIAAALVAFAFGVVFIVRRSWRWLALALVGVAVVAGVPVGHEYVATHDDGLPAWAFPIAFVFVVLTIFGLVEMLLMWREGKAEEAARVRAEEADQQDCPYCAERIKRTAKLCRFCGSRVVSPTSSTGNFR